MLDLLSPLRGYIAQSLQFYLSKYIEDIQLERLGLFGGDLVLNDLKIKRHVLRESLDIPSSFDFSRGFIRELRIHIPWTQLLSQPIEVKLYTIELILTAKNEHREQRAARGTTVMTADEATDEQEEERGEEERSKMEHPKSGWIHDTLQTILSNISVQVNNLVLKYEHDDIVFSIALGTLDFYSASASSGWTRSFDHLKREQRVICKSIDAKDVTIFLDRYMSAECGPTQDPVRRNVIGYEVPVLSRTSASVRAKLQLFPSTLSDGQNDRSGSPSFSRPAVHQQRHTASHDDTGSSMLDVGELCAHRPSVLCDPFYLYSHRRSCATPMYELDVFIGQLSFSVSDRQLEMLNQLVKSASAKMDQDHKLPTQRHSPEYVRSGSNKARRPSVPHVPVVSAGVASRGKKVHNLAKEQESWFGWAMNALGTAEDGKEEDELVSELLAETRRALLKVQPPSSHGNGNPSVANGPITKIFCVRLCISSVSMMLRKHDSMSHENEHQDFAAAESGEELVPVANLGMVRVIAQKTRRKVARPAMPILSMSLSYVALEVLLPCREEQDGMDLVLEIDKVELTSATFSENREDLQCRKGQVLLTCGSSDLVHSSDNVCHPYFTNSFFREEATRRNRREARSVEIVKVSLDAGVPAWKTLEPKGHLDGRLDLPCECSTTWDGESIHCVPIATLSRICQDAIRSIGIKERILDEGMLSNTVFSAWASHGSPISISEGLARSLVSIVEEYRIYRNPDVGALDNLAQLLQPQLISLFARYTLHTCSASSLYSSSDCTNTQHRSVHSALRLHLSSTSTSTDHKRSPVSGRTKEKATCRVLDVSIGAVHAMLEPVKCLEIAEALSIILRGNEAADIAKTTTADPESAKPVTPHAARSIESVLEKDVKLITVSSVCICLPDQSTEQKQGELDATSRDNLIVTARDFAWSETSHPGRNERHLHLGTLSIHLKRPSSQLTPMTLAEALGLDCSVTNSSADGDDNDCLCGNLNKLKVGFSTSAAQDVASMVNGISLHFGHSITWEAPIMTPKMLQTAFQIEVCRMEFSGAVSNRPRLVAAQLSAEVASISANLTRTGRTNEVVLQGGIAPMTVSKAELTTPLFKLEVMQENSSGALNDLPLCGPLALFSLNLGPLATTCLSCHLSTNAQLARMFADVQGVLQIVDAALDLVQRVKASLPPQQESDTRGQNSAHDAVKEDVVQSALADWSFKIDLKAAGGDIRVNEALRLKLPLLSVSSVEMDAGQLAQVKTGNALAIECTMKDIILSASESGVLKHMEDSKVLVIQGIHVSTAISRSLADGRLACAVDMTLCVSSIQASLSRLKLLYLLKYPTREVKAHSRNLLRHQVPELRKRDEPDIGSKEAAYIKWHWRLGAQLDHVSVSCTADISRQSARRDQATRVVVDGKIVNLAIAARVGNYHPIRNDVRPAVECGCFTDIQATVGDVQVLEKLQNARRGVHSAFGEFSRLHEPAFLGILVCLDLSDLQCLSESLSVSDSSIADQQSLPPAMLSWHLTSCLAKSFHEVCVEQLQREAQRKSIVAEIPLILSWKDSASMAHPFPLLSGFYRNYSEAGLPRYVFAGSMESVDAAVTTSSLYCLATLMDVGDKLASLPDLASRTSMGEVDDSGTRVPSVSDALPRISLANVEVSVWLGCIRLFLPSERLMDGIMLVRPVSGNAFVVLESLSVASAARNDISLDGLGYPPFNSRVLPRRATVQAQRFGQSQLRIGCRAGKITGYVAELKFGDFEMPAGKSHTEAGPFESHIGRMAGCVARFSDVETFWSPLNLICSLEEEPFVTGDGKDAGVKTVATLALTKWRLDLHKVVFDTLIARVLGVSQGISVLSRSLVIPARVAQLSTLQKHFPALERTHRRAVSFSCDGIEIQMFEPNRATHIRIGAVALVHDSSTLSGSASIQNLAVGYRANEGAPSSTHNDVAIEEVVFGANAEPSLWHLSVENYPEKLIAARWNFGDRSDRTLFLDVQAVQLHVSDHFVQESSRFTHSEPTFVFAKLYREEKSSEQLVLSRNNKSFAFRPRWSIKVLVAPSVISYCGRAHAEGRAAGIWIRSGQLFASAGVGNNDKTQQSILSYGQSVNEITRFVVVPTLEVMVNIDKLGVNTTWQEFSKYISVVSEAQRLLHDCSVRITGGQHQMLERVAVGDIGVCLLYTDMVRVNVQAEVNALRVKISSFSLGAIHSLLRAPSVSDKQCDKHSYSSPGCTSAGHASGFTSSRNHALKSLQESSTDDFKMLRRVAVGRRPSPGELVFMESLMIETTSVVSTDTSPTAGANVQIQLDPNKFGIKLADTVAYIEDCNEPWIVEEHELGSEPSLCTGMGNKTHSWVGMRWCYHIPRKVHKIVANAVPHPPTGVLKGWPVWSWDQRQDRDADRLCDILCQLRCWDSKRTCYAVVCEFYVPWEAASATTGSDRSDDASEPETFIELMNQWFDDDVEKARYRSKLLEFGARTRTFSFDSNLPSDNWELRWRAPLQGEQELESKQKRLEINALLASSLQVYSVLTLDAYQRIVGTVTLPRTTLSVSHVGSENDSYDIVTAELNETVISCATAGSRHTRTLNVRLSSSMQAYLDNMAQLLTVSIIPRTAIEATVEISSKGVELTTRVGPVSIHLNQTTMLVLSAIPKLLQAKNEACEGRRVNPDNKLRNMRIKVVNCSGMGVWYRQEGTPECLFVAADTSAAYSWLSLASSPFYQICFAMDDTNEKVAETHNRENKEADGESETHTNLHWTSLPTDFDPMQSQVSWRYTWMEVSLWPAISAENMLDFPVAISFAQKATFVELEIAPSTEKSLAIINPCEPVDVQLRYDPSSCSAQPVAESLMFCIANEDSSEHVTVFEGCKVVVSFCKDRHPMVRIRIERSLSIANMTPSILAINISSPPGDRRASEKIGSCAERSVGCRIVGTYLVISIATLQDLNNEAGSMNWSPEISLNVKGDAKPVVVPAVGPGPSSLVNAYCIEMVNRDGFLKLVIRPQVVMVNSTLIPHNNHGWCVPVYLHKEEEKKGFTAGVSSWFSSKLSRHPGEDAVKASNQVLVTRISCSFRVSLVEDGYSWTEEISVMLPEASLLADPVGNLERVEARPLSTSSKNTDNLYPVPSTTTHRRRLLIRHRDFRHKMLTYTVTQNGKSIQVLFFDDHQPPVVIYNQCQRALGFRSVSFSSDPEGVGAAFYLEYDWDLQISQRRRKSTQKQAEDIPKRSDEDANELLSGWLRDSQSLESVPMSDSIKNDRMRFQIGLPQYGWSNALWQVGGIQFASFTNEKEGAVDTATPTFLVMCLYRAGSWVITITCLEDPTRDSHALGQAPSLISPAMASPATLQGIKPTSLRVSLVVEELSLRFCDEYDPVQDERGMIVYPEILRLTCDAVSAVFATAPDPPEVSLHSARLGYLSHIRSYTTVFVAIGDIEVGHSLNTCNFPLILCFQKTHESKKLLQLDLVGNLLGKQLPGKENVSLLARVIYVDTWDPVNVPSYFHTVELKLSPAVLQVEDDILSYMNAFIRPMLDAFGGEAASGMIGKCGTRDCETSHDDVWSLYAYESAMISTQRKVYIEHLEISNIDVIITARVSIPVLNSFDGTPLHFGSTKLRDVFSFPDQLYKDLAADYVADTIVRSPLLLMSLNIIGNPAGFVRSFGQGVRNLVEIPLAASKKGYNPWLLTKGVVGGVASFLGHATVATLTSVSGFSYSISRTVDQLTLPVDQLRKRHYIRPTHLSSALAEGLGALGSSVVGAAAGVVTTPIAVYKERQRQGLDTGLRNVVGGVGMGLVGIVARPMGGVASLVSMASDGLLYGINSNQTPFSDSASRVGAQPNELLRYKLKVLPDEVGSNLVFAHGIWVVSDENQLTVSGQSLDFISSGHLDAPENESLCSLLLPCDKSRRLVQVTLVCSNICVYVVGVSGAHYDAVLVRTLLESIKAVEESLTEPTVFDLGIKTLASAEWLRFRLLPRQRRLLSHQLRLWMDEDSVL
ncbi:unnamed protein product [Hyaloperonospora brassicae]|uniref:Chorein N-terminal domain-containing protein n=1 Tax=Hyaloperonospora brassicae TaxID=162125 RepID=A0AAV0TXE0_HYABA|nr:unnamed protein product [Hyaloperonospora brassicae]